MKKKLIVLLCAFLPLGFVEATEISVAVAANFAKPIREIRQLFRKHTGHEVKISIGATGSLYAHIKNGAPYHMLLAADQKTITRLERKDYTLPNSRFTYATGRLVLWSAHPQRIDAQGTLALSNQPDKRIRFAMANPKFSPYGLAAQQTLPKLDFKTRSLQILQAHHVGLAFQWVLSGNVPLGLVALSQVFAEGKIHRGSGWIIPQDYHAPIRQDAVLLKPRGSNTKAQLETMATAHEFAQFLRTEQIRKIIAAYGYQP